MDLNIKNENWFKVIRFLSYPENQDKEFFLNDIYLILKVPKDEFQKTYHALTWISPKYIDTKPSLKFPLVKINAHGIALIERFNEAKRLDEQRNFISYVDKVLFYITKDENKNVHSSKEISDILDINIKTAELIAEELAEVKPELVKLSINEGYYNIFVLSHAYRFVRKTSFEQEKKRNQLNIESLIHAPDNKGMITGNILGEGFSITQTNESKPDKQTWYSKIWDEITKSIINYTVTAGLAFLLGLATGKSCNSADNQKPLLQDSSQITFSKPFVAI